MIAWVKIFWLFLGQRNTKSFWWLGRKNFLLTILGGNVWEKHSNNFLFEKNSKSHIYFGKVQSVFDYFAKIDLLFLKRKKC